MPERIYIIQIDESYSWFMVTLPIHPDFLKVVVDDIVNDTVNDIVNDTVIIELTKRQLVIIQAIKENERITIEEITSFHSVTRSTITRDLATLKGKES